MAADGEKQMAIDTALMNLPAYGALNVWKVAAGTGEALPGPTALRKCGRRSVPSYNRAIRELGVVPGGRRRRP